MVKDEIDAGARGQGGKLFKEFEGLKDEVACAVGPLTLELQQDAPVAGELEAILGDGRPQQVAADLLEPGAILCRYKQIGVEIEAFDVGLAGAGRDDPSP